MRSNAKQGKNSLQVLHLKPSGGFRLNTSWAFFIRHSSSRFHVLHGTRYRMRHLCTHELDMFCMHAFRVSKLDLPMSSLTQTLVCRHGTRRYTTNRSIIVPCSAEELGALHVMQPSTQSPSHVIRQRAPRQRALSSLKTGRFGHSKYYSPPRLFFSVPLNNAQTWTEFGALHGV